MTVRRPVGVETEYGILEPGNPYANAIAMSHHLVTAYGASGPARGPGSHAVRWDYTGEDPLSDARGYRMDRASAHPSQLTDNPDQAAPSGDAVLDGRASNVQRPPVQQVDLRPRAASMVLTNGARLYVDHAHPEYSGPECMTPREVVRWDRAGDRIMTRAMDLAAALPGAAEVIAYKNNVDGKGAAYGTHENYLVSRAVDFGDLVDVLTPFFVTRPIICGAGRVGLGQRSEEPGFQISQRADYVENDVGLETTFNRPIINTRDEPHSDYDRFRRLHVIGGDANLFDVSTYLKVATTSLVLWVAETAQGVWFADGGATVEVPEVVRAAAQQAMEAMRGLAMVEPVDAVKTVSRDLTMRVPIPLADGREAGSLEIQRAYLEAVRGVLAEQEAAGVAVDADTTEAMRRWEGVLDGLATDPMTVVAQVEWVAKYQLVDRMRRRAGGTDAEASAGRSWAAPRLAALDLQWHDLRTERSIIQRLDAAGRIERLATLQEVVAAEVEAPRSTRAFLRGGAVKAFGDGVVAAGWGSILLDVPGREDLVRIPLQDPRKGNAETMEPILAVSKMPADFLAALTGGGAAKR